jgi:hypothetical protein
MSKRLFGLTAIAILLLSPTLVSANEPIDATHLTVGKIQITTNNNRTSINTPNLQLDTPTTTDSPLLSRRQRSRTLVRKRTPAVVRPRVEIDDDNEPIVIIFPSQSTPTIPNVPKVPSVPSVQTSTIRTIPTVRSSTIRTTRDDNDSLSVSEQHQSVQCNGNGTVSQSSSSTINGRTVKSEVRYKCY